MSERHHSQPIPPNSSVVYPMAQWSNASQYQAGYSSSPGHYPAAHNPHPSLRTHPSMSQQQYEAMLAQNAFVAEYPASHPYSHDRTSAMPMQQQSPYAQIDRSGVPMSQSPTRHSHSPTQSYPARSLAIPHPYSQQPYDAYPTATTPPHQSGHMVAMSSGQYPAQVAFGQQMDGPSSQFPASPQRPFSCDMCALSFNRQHDLKRHRDTHTGEKPFLCNGGCGKTFTRKDALKRHQLVKRCGIDEGA